MIGYTSLGTNNLARSAAFYDELLAHLGAKRFMETDSFVAWSIGQAEADFSIHVPFDGNEATVGNGCMIALRAKDAAQVAELHARALELGGTDEGAPGERMPGFFAAYFRDPDGNKLNLHSLSMPG